MLFSLKSITIFTLLLITLFKWVDSRSAPSSSTTTRTESTTTTRDTKTTESSESSSSSTSSTTSRTESRTTSNENLESFSSLSPSSPSPPSTESKSSSGRISRRSTNWNFSSSTPAANQPPISLKLIIKLIGGIIFSITLLCMCCCLNFRDKRAPGYSGSGASIRGYRSGTMRRGTQQA